jgi:hypothetical protein
MLFFGNGTAALFFVAAGFNDHIIGGVIHAYCVFLVVNFADSYPPKYRRTDTTLLVGAVALAVHAGSNGGRRDWYPPVVPRHQLCRVPLQLELMFLVHSFAFVLHLPVASRENTNSYILLQSDLQSTAVKEGVAMLEREKSHISLATVTKIEPAPSP